MIAASSFGELYLWGAVLLGLIALGIVGAYVARAVRERMQQPPTAEPFTLQDLRAMRDRGDLTPAEYETMRAGLLGRVLPSKSPPPSDAGPADDTGLAGDGDAGGDE